MIDGWLLCGEDISAEPKRPYGISHIKIKEEQSRENAQSRAPGGYGLSLSSKNPVRLEGKEDEVGVVVHSEADKVGKEQPILIYYLD